MDKYEFLIELSSRLHALEVDDIKPTLDYYSEMIDDRMEDGLTEQEAVAAIGSIDEVVNTILAGAPHPQAVPAQPKPSRRLRWWEIVLLILGSPIWVSLAIAAAAVVFSVWISLWSVVISLYAATLALGISIPACLFGSVSMFLNNSLSDGLVTLGAALLIAGLAILMFMLSNLAAKGMVALTKLILRGIKGMFTRKEQAV